MIAEDVEFQISQYHDGTLPPAERSAVEELLKTEPAARQLLADFQKLDTHLAKLRLTPPVMNPAVKWENFAAEISATIDEADAPAVVGRIGFGAWAGKLRIAAAILIVATVGIILRHGSRPDPNHNSVIPRSVADPVNPPPTVNTPELSGLADVRGPAAEAPAGSAQEDVSFGPSPVAAAEGTSRYADRLIVPGQSKVVITEAIAPKPKEKSRPH